VLVAEREEERGEGDEKDEAEEEEEDEGWRLVSKGIGECEWAEAVRTMGGGRGGEGPKVTRGLLTTEEVVGGRDWPAREELGIGRVAEGGSDAGQDMDLIVPFSRNGASWRSQQKVTILTPPMETGIEL
jgi:hypothetical protein